MAGAVRTFSRARWEEARAAWDAGEFSDEWAPFRERAARHGFIFPPAGTRWDNWEDDQPSQRAMLIRAIRETPELLRRCIDGASSWSDVIGQLIGLRDVWREDVGIRISEIERLRRDERPSRRQAMESFGSIARRIAEDRS